MSIQAYTTQSIQQFLTKNGMTLCPILSIYSLDLTSTNFFWCPWMKGVLKGKHFADMEEVK